MQQHAATPQIMIPVQKMVNHASDLPYSITMLMNGRHKSFRPDVDYFVVAIVLPCCIIY